MPGPAFVDCHSHVCPSRDDGVDTIGEGIALCTGAALHGTSILYATPHVWPHLPLTDEREAQIRDSFAILARSVALELRLGFELTPARPLLDEDPHRYALAATDAVLIEVPFAGRLDLLVACAEHIEAAGLRPLLAHPERTEAVMSDVRVADWLAERWPLQVNATSLLGRHGPTAEQLGWGLLERGRAALVASDGHRQTRPPHLDEAFAAARRRLGETAAVPLFDGSALGVVVSARRTASRAASTGA